MNASIIPVYLYKHYNSDNCLVTISEQSDSSLKLIAKFYCIDPTINPIPPGTALMCAENVPEDQVTINIFQIYNSYDHSLNCTRFTAWFDAVPYTSPLYISKRGNNIYMSFDSSIPKDYENVYFSPIYVLVDPRMNVKKTQGYRSTQNSFKIINNEPQFLFSSYQGGCLPDPDGISLETCINKYVKNVPGKSFEPTLINYLNQKYGKENFVLFFLIFIFLIFVFIFLVFRK